MGKPGATGITRIIHAIKYSYQGLIAAFRNESAFRQELALTLILVPVAVLLGNTNVERALMIGSLLIVLIVELLNSGLESIVDRVGSEPHELSGRAKDIGSAAVFISLVNVLVIWGIILFT